MTPIAARAATASRARAGLQARADQAAKAAGIARSDLPVDPADVLELLGDPDDPPRRTAKPAAKPTRSRPAALPADPNGPLPAGKPAAKTKPKAAAKTATPKKKAAKRRRSPASRASLTVKRSIDSGVREVSRPVQAGGSIAGLVIVGSLALIVLYLALSAADALRWVIDAPVAAVRWLADPTASIPFAN